MSKIRTALVRRHLLALAAVLLVPLMVGGFVVSQRGAPAGARLFHEVLSLVESEAVEPVDTDSLYELAARGLVRRLGDPYAELYSPEELELFSREALRGDYGGLGILIEDQDGTATVLRVFPGTPAEQGGVRPGDRIIAVEGEATTGWKLDQVSDRLLGPAGTDVAVTFARPGVPEPIVTTFTRALVHVPAVPYAVMLEDGIGYVPLQQFSNSSGEEVEEAIRSLLDRGAERFVLDLRGNNGGSLQQSVVISDLFLPRGVEIASVRYRNQPNEVFTSSRPPLLADQPVVVLTDGGSASAAEIVAGALQDQDRALVLGTETFGKGLVQDLYRLDGGWALKLTTGKWYTPSGRSIQKPRRLDENGMLVDDTTAVVPREERPVFRSAAGRVVFGGGGVTPDLALEADTLDAAEQALMRQLAPHASQTYQALAGLARELQPTVGEDFRVTPAWRDEFFRRLREADVPVEREVYDAGSDLVDQLLEERVATVAFGEAAAFRRGVPRDRQLLRAVELLRESPTTESLLAKAPPVSVPAARERAAIGAGG